MIKAPRAGAVKTRLVPPLTHEEAAALSVCFLRDTTENIASVSVEGGASGVAVYTPVGLEAAFDNLLPRDFALLTQRGDGFGERLFYAVEDLLSVGFESLCLIDSDSPTLPTGLLATAVATLARSGDRVVLGATDDGGYYLIGVKRAHRRLFEDIDWSTARVLAQTVERAAEVGLETVILPTWYDVDDGATLKRLCDELFLTTIQKTTGARNTTGAENLEEVQAGYAAPFTREYLARLMALEGRERLWPLNEARAERAGE
jgi:rSAM/selenodomain-associated transferase 1